MSSAEGGGFSCKRARSAQRRTVALVNAAARLQVDLSGGSLQAFQLRGALAEAPSQGGRLCEAFGVNPLSWDAAAHDGRDTECLEPRMMGHFLCCDRWGPASEAEEANGMPYHGEATAVNWDAVDGTDSSALVMSAMLPMAGLKVLREVKLLKTSTHTPSGSALPVDKFAVAVVSEQVTNINKLSRIYNLVQHPSIAQPFLNADTVIDCNGKRGFAQGDARTFDPSPAAQAFEFPDAINRAGSHANARLMTGGEDDVVSYEIEPGAPIGWVCATSARNKLLFGYVWRPIHYPWISLWCSSRDGAPCARGLEFGTTGLHQPFDVLARHPAIFDLSTYKHIDAEETQTYRYVTFLVEVPDDFGGVSGINLEGEVLTVSEHGGRVFSLTAEGLDLPTK